MNSILKEKGHDRVSIKPNLQSLVGQEMISCNKLIHMPNSIRITLRPSKAMAVDALWLGLDALYFYGIRLYSGLRCPSAVALKLSAPQNL